MAKILVKKADTFFSQARGLLGYKEPFPLLLTTRFGIHTFFLSYAIDVVILDRQKRVVTLFEQVKPNRIVFWNPKYNLVLELPSGDIKKYHLTLGFHIQLHTI